MYRLSPRELELNDPKMRAYRQKMEGFGGRFKDIYDRVSNGEPLSDPGIAPNPNIPRDGIQAPDDDPRMPRGGLRPINQIITPEEQAAIDSYQAAAGYNQLDTSTGGDPYYGGVATRRPRNYQNGARDTGGIHPSNLRESEYIDYRDPYQKSMPNSDEANGNDDWWSR